jgi:hypothetical protein
MLARRSQNCSRSEALLRRHLLFVRGDAVLRLLAPDPDTIGYANWVTTLTADPSNFRHMIFGFIYSDEYRHRLGP